MQRPSVKTLASLAAALALAASSALAADIRGANNAVIGKIDADGTVRNASNATIGTAKGVKRSWAAAYFFFFFRK